MRLVYIGFVLTGIVTTLLGPVLPMLSRRWSLADTDAGLLFTAQFLGNVLGVGLSSVLAARWSVTTMLAVGASLMAVGVAAMTPVGWPTSLGFVGCYGIGLGFTIPITNVLVAETSPDRRAAALNLVNVAWGLGAIAGPAALGGLTGLGREDIYLPSISIALALAAIAYVRRARLEPRPLTRAEQPGSPEPLWRAPAMALFVTLFFLYSGTESSLAGWIASYAERMPETTAGAAVLAPACFWIALLIGRALAPAALTRLTESALIMAGLTLAVGASAVLLAVRSAEGVVICATIGGLGLSAVFPTIIARMTRAFEGEAARAAGPTFAASAFGGAVVPWLVGAVSTSYDSLRAGLMVPFIGCLALLSLSLVSARRAKHGTMEMSDAPEA